MFQLALERLSEMARQRGRPFRVLIIDDEKWVREVFHDFCRITDAFEVELADSGADALEKVKCNSYDLITLDLIMPEMSGLEVLTAVKGVLPQVPVVVVTGNATDKLVRKAGMLGACRVMYKPVMLEHFISELATTLRV